MHSTRRRFLSTLGTAGVVWGVERLIGAQNLAPAGGQLVRTMPLGRFDGRPAPPLGTLLGSGLDARQFTDLSSLAPDTLITPTGRFYVRTAFANANASPGRWTIGMGGRVRQPVDVVLDTLAPLARPMGTHVMECSGNSDPANFGLLSAARWSGLPIALLLDRVEPLPEASRVWRVRVTGLDDESRPSQSSLPGASWIFLREDLERAGAFLATGMNDAVLPPDHGFPVRLVVPNWYGCTCIKWVSRIDLVGDDEPATVQMREFAARTHQSGLPALGRDFQPAIIDLAAMPVRVEQWRINGRLSYRVVGVRWGGSKPSGALTIRFKHDQPFVPVDDCPVPSTTTTWSLWSHRWRPASPGRYQIALGVSDPSIRARRLDLFYYTREVEIDEAAGPQA